MYTLKKRIKKRISGNKPEAKEMKTLLKETHTDTTVTEMLQNKSPKITKRKDREMAGANQEGSPPRETKMLSILPKDTHMDTTVTEMLQNKSPKITKRKDLEMDGVNQEGLPRQNLRLNVLQVRPKQTYEILMLDSYLKSIFFHQSFLYRKI